MKKFFSEFLKRGFMSAWGGPIILAIIYYFVGRSGSAVSLSFNEASMGIISITLMGFIAGGMTAIYRNEKLPVALSALIHAGILYLDYLIIYLLNDWIPKNPTAITTFSVIFAAGFAFIWLIIYLCIRSQTDNVNKLRSKKI